MRALSETEVQAWVADELLSPTRTRPIVAVTSHPGSDAAWIDPAALQAEIGELAEVVFLVTGEATWALTECLPPRLDVYGGALRIWWPGLTRNDDVYAHRLFFVNGAWSVDEVRHQIVAELRQRAGLPALAKAPPTPPTPPKAPPAAVAKSPPPVKPTNLVLRRMVPLDPPVPGRVVAVQALRITVRAGDRHGPITESDLPLPLLAELVAADVELTVRPLRPLGDGTWAFSIAGLLPNPWSRAAAGLRPGDVVMARVQSVNAPRQIAFVDVLPGVVGLCHVSEFDWDRVANLSEHMRAGDLLAFAVLDVDAAKMTLSLSRKRAHGQSCKPLPALFAGGPAFAWKVGMPVFESLRRSQPDGAGLLATTALRIEAHHAPQPRQSMPGPGDERLDALQQELDAANRERRNLVQQIRTTREQVQELRRELRASEDRGAGLERRLSEADPLASERAFAQAIRVEYARRWDEDDRQRQPLQRLRIGREFLASVRSMVGIDLAKVIEVCAEVACNVAPGLPGREVHALGQRGDGNLTRKRDGAMAWRCALQIHTPSARRLHWWSVPGPSGATIEFACVVVHDDFGIPDG